MSVLRICCDDAKFENKASLMRKHFCQRRYSKQNIDRAMHTIRTTMKDVGQNKSHCGTTFFSAAFSLKFNKVK